MRQQSFFCPANQVIFRQVSNDKMRRHMCVCTCVRLKETTRLNPDQNRSVNIPPYLWPASNALVSAWRVKRAGERGLKQHAGVTGQHVLAIGVTFTHIYAWELIQKHASVFLKWLESLPQGPLWPYEENSHDVTWVPIELKFEVSCVVCACVSSRFNSLKKHLLPAENVHFFISHFNNFDF